MNNNEYLQQGVEIALISLMEEYSEIVVVLADMGRTIFTDKFLEEYSDRIYNVGIAEQNALSVCGGLATAGLKPIFVTYASFMINRGLDQLINSIASSNLPVVLIGIRAGLSGSGGLSHYSISDIGILKHVPNISIYEGCSCQQIINLLHKIVDNETPTYLRVCDEHDWRLNLKSDYNVKLGGSHIIHEGKDCMILTYGKMVSRALHARKLLEKDNISVGVTNFYSIEPLDRETLNYLLSVYDNLLVLEEHYAHTGLAADILEHVNHNEKRNKIKIISVPNKNLPSARRGELYYNFRLTGRSIANEIRKFWK